VLRFILLTILFILVARAFWKLMDGVMAAARGRGEGTPPLKLVRDPVCGTFVAPRSALSLTSGGSTHYFCSEECRRQFQR
jgi:YHS domain-containing protein